ncbi:hypothetical protein PtA15_8A774 [Puccinia triticina]|uniref:Uncharacterized protein n=1 Tax=Puccinia triticina TaxID=208348 RepID=A0ABY7CYS4_9BASI|nr:uncharacterized protein PtA15_8A774 [Puccinia triticina]WAQ87867.1 hypothetical protein PtA15_8A774 [Puccinia triticina]WAR57746.1 hypothetical protein PtB15_8B799 [Puccinia triticina]
MLMMVWVPPLLLNWLHGLPLDLDGFSGVRVVRDGRMSGRLAQKYLLYLYRELQVASASTLIHPKKCTHPTLAHPSLNPLDPLEPEEVKVRTTRTKNSVLRRSIDPVSGMVVFKLSPLPPL